MKLERLRINGFQSFGSSPTEISFSKMTYLLGPNGAGKTAVMSALCRLFSVDPSLKKVRRSDFHQKIGDAVTFPLELWIEAEFTFGELTVNGAYKPTIPAHFAHMQLPTADGVPLVRIRLAATLDEEGEIEETTFYVVETDTTGAPAKTLALKKFERNYIQLHYLPAQRDPSDHISYSTTAIIGRLLRSADWSVERENISKLTDQITDKLISNKAIAQIATELSTSWKKLHKGTYFSDPKVTFGQDEVENLLKHLTIGFTPAPHDKYVDYSLLSDGQKSLLYISVVMIAQVIGRKVLSKTIEGFDAAKLKPAVFTIFAIEEPENSLAPHYLGRILNIVKSVTEESDAQALVATHSPSLLRRVEPTDIRYLRLNIARESTVRSIVLPPVKDEAHKFVREAVMAFPELYFSRLVVLGEGDSEEIVLPRAFSALGIGADESAISIAPLGGRHVNHFWRLLHSLEIPYLTLLDLDVGRFGGGWGRLKYVADNLLKFPVPGSTLTQHHIDQIPKWNDPRSVLTDELGIKWIKWLESYGVFFTDPLDLDFAMISKFPDEYGIDIFMQTKPDEVTIKAVLGKSHGDVTQYSESQQENFDDYHRQFKLGSKPSAHISAMAQIDDQKIQASAPSVLLRLTAAVATKLSDLPE